MTGKTKIEWNKIFLLSTKGDLQCKIREYQIDRDYCYELLNELEEECDLKELIRRYIGDDTHYEFEVRYHEGRDHIHVEFDSSNLSELRDYLERMEDVGTRLIHLENDIKLIKEHLGLHDG